MQYWIIKSEPKKYSFEQMKADKKTVWDGVRNYEARNNLKAMQKGDICFFYHSNDGKEIVGITEVVKPFFPDPTIDDDTWVAVEVKYKKTAKHTIDLAAMKLHSGLTNLGLIKRSRLSVIPVPAKEAAILMGLIGLEG